MRDNITENFFPVHIQPITNDSNAINNQLCGFKDSQKDMRGCV